MSQDVLDNKEIPAAALAILCWAEVSSPFGYQQICDRFPEVFPHIADHLKALCEQGFLERNTAENKEGTDTELWSFIAPPEDDVPQTFADFCKAYSAAGGYVKSKKYCWGRLKKHKGYRQILKLLLPAFEKQLAFRARQKASGQFVAPHRNLETYINQRGWEDMSPEIESAQPAQGLEYQGKYMPWLRAKFGANAQPAVSEQQYLDYKHGRGVFSGILRKLTQGKMAYLFERAHIDYFNGSCAGKTCFERLVELYKTETA